MTCKQAWLALVGLVACDTPHPHPTVIQRMPGERDLDVLFVIDNSTSTTDKQALFAQNFVSLANRLDQSMDGRPNLHIGVVTTTVGTGSDNPYGPDCPKSAPNDDGLLVNTPRVAQCTPPQGRYLIDVSDEEMRTTNYSGSLADAFSCIAQVGTDGCGFEAPLEAMKRALDGSRPENAGFVRPQADLAVIVLADEDDCSVTDPTLFSLNGDGVGVGDFRCQPMAAYDCDQAISASAPGNYTHCTPHHGGYLGDPAAYATFLRTIKDPSQLMVAVIAGDPTSSIATGQITVPFQQALAVEPSCQTTIDGNVAIARPALRLDEFRQEFGDRGTFQSVCQSDYSPALEQIAGDMLDMMGPCLDAAIDPATCVVTEREQFGTAGQVDVALPACAMSADGTLDPGGARPCWWMQSTSACASSGMALHVERVTPAPVGSLVETACAAR